jgi:sec-independent protein translocase protein TatC
MVSLRRKGNDRRPKLATPDDKMTLMEHLAELRNRIVKSVLAIVLSTIGVFTFYDPVLKFLDHPYTHGCAVHPKWHCLPGLTIIGPLDGFLTRTRVSLYGGIILALPVLLWQIWKFVTPGLHPNEKRYAIPFVLSSVLLFAFGAFIAYWILPKALEFLIAYAGPGTSASFTPDKYIGLVTLMMAAFGVGFLFPVLLVFLMLINVLKPKQLLLWWRQALVLVFVVAAVITPSGDPFSLFALAIPMFVFYWAAVLIGWLLVRKRAKAQAASPAA